MPGYQTLSASPQLGWTPMGGGGGNWPARKKYVNFIQSYATGTGLLIAWNMYRNDCGIISVKQIILDDLFFWLIYSLPYLRSFRKLICQLISHFIKLSILWMYSCQYFPIHIFPLQRVEQQPLKEAFYIIFLYHIIFHNIFLSRELNNNLLKEVPAALASCVALERV